MSVLKSLLSSRFTNEDDADDPRTIDVVGNIVFDCPRLPKEGGDSALPSWTDVLGHILLLVIGISFRKNPCDGSSNLISKASHPPAN